MQKQVILMSMHETRIDTADVEELDFINWLRIFNQNSVGTISI